MQCGGRKTNGEKKGGKGVKHSEEGEGKGQEEAVPPGQAGGVKPVEAGAHKGIVGRGREGCEAPSK